MLSLKSSTENIKLLCELDPESIAQSLQEIESAAVLSFSAEFIEDLDQGYNNIIGDMGTKLSGGQKQTLQY